VPNIGLAKWQGKRTNANASIATSPSPKPIATIFQPFNILTTQISLKRIWLSTPIIGTVLFVILYFVSTLFYPGGSQFDKNSVGFSWTDNYWCNLLDEKAINGQTNSARQIAMTAMLVLCLTLIFFWFQFPKYTNLSENYKVTIKASGTLAMLIGFFLFTKVDHDLITNLASLFGLLATIGTFIGLHKNRWKSLFYFGLLNILLFVVNAFLYYNKEYILYLPLVQKITFVTFLTWICLINFKMTKEKGPITTHL